MHPNWRRRQIWTCCCLAAVPGAAMSQPCHPYFSDMGATPYSFLESYFAVHNDGTGPTLFRGDPVDQVLVRWTTAGWQPVSMQGAPVGFQPIWPIALQSPGQSQLYLYGVVGLHKHLLRWDTGIWVPSGICYGQNECPPYEVVGIDLILADLGGGANIYATGYRPFQSDMYEVVRWNGTSWDSLGTSNRFISALIVFDDGTGAALYALGDFSMIAGVSARGLAKWNSVSWTAATPPDTRVYTAKATIVTDLGDGSAIYTTAKVFRNGQDYVGVNKWDGSQWTFVGAPDQLPPPATPRYVNTIAAFDDGRGMALYISGVFQSFSGVPARNIVRFDGLAFEALGVGVSSPLGDVDQLHAFRDARGPALYIGGDGIVGAGGGVLQQSGVLWVGCPNCYANCDLSTRAPTLNVSDFICFLNKFAAKDPYANCTVDGAIDINDFVCFLNKFDAGCP